MRTANYFLLTILAANSAGVTIAQQPPLSPQAELRELTQAFENGRSEIERKNAASEALRRAREEGLLLEKEAEMLAYLLESATQALSLDVPYPLAFDAEGNAIRGQLSSEFVGWASANGMDPGQAARLALIDHPIEIARLIGSSDPAVLTTFENALQVRNHLVVLLAASGLAVADYSPAIPQIEAVALSSPAELGLSLAEELDTFGSPEAHTAAEEIRAHHQ